MLRESPELWQRPPPDAADDTQCVLDESTGTGSGPGPGSGGGPGSGVGAVHPTTVRTAPSTVVAGRAIVCGSRSPPRPPSVPSGAGPAGGGSPSPPALGTVGAGPARERLHLPALHPHLDLEAQPGPIAIELRPVKGHVGLGTPPRAGLTGIRLGPLHRPEDAAIRLEILPHETVGAAAGDRRVARLGRGRGCGEPRHHIRHPRRLHLAAAGLGGHPDHLVHVLGLPGDDRAHAAGPGLGAFGLAGATTASATHRPASPAAAATVGWSAAVSLTRHAGGGPDAL